MAHLIPTPNPTPKPIFVIRLDNTCDAADRRRMCDEIYKSEMAKEYHVLVIENDSEKNEFEMFNADRIERQEWNELINKINK